MVTPSASPGRSTGSGPQRPPSPWPRSRPWRPGRTSSALWPQTISFGSAWPPLRATRCVQHRARTGAPPEIA